MDTILEALRILSPAYMTGVVRNLMPERFFLTEKLGGGPVTFHATPAAIIDVVEGSYPLAPMGNDGDPATRVNMGEKSTPISLVCPQIFLEDQIGASDVNVLIQAGVSPLYSGDAGSVAAQRGAALRERANLKAKLMVDAIARRVEWQFAKTLHAGKYVYENRLKQTFSVDFETPSGNFFNAAAAEQWTNGDVDINQALRGYILQYTEKNGYKPTLIIVGSAAAKAFYENETTREWRQSPNMVMNALSMVNNSVSDDLIFTLATLPDIGPIVQYGGTFTDETGRKTGTYLDDNCLYLTNPRAWRMDYGSISDFDIHPDGTPFLGTRASKTKISDDGKALRLFVESHPLPVLVNRTGVMRIKAV
jgi:hypothetical protein